MVSTTLLPLGDSDSLVQMIEPTVWVRPNWKLGWRQVPGLYCTRLSTAAGSIGRAELRREHGYTKRNRGWALQRPVDLMRHWVQIRWKDNRDTTHYWNGLITADETSSSGKTGPRDTGEQNFVAQELSWCFGRVTWRGATYYPNRFSNVAVGINTDPRTGELMPNKRFGQLQFELEDQASAEYWTPADVLNLILPNVFVGDNHPALSVGSYPSVNFAPQMKLQDRTILQILNELFDERRAMQWYLNHTLTGSMIMVASHAITAITLPSGASILPNSRILSVTHDASNAVHAAIYHRDSSPRFEQVAVRGSSLGSVCTFSPRTGELVPDWTTDQQLNYVLAQSAVDPAGYAIMSREKKILANDTLRSSPPLDRVFSAFRVPRHIAGTGAGLDAAVREVIFPTVDADGDVTQFADNVWEITRIDLELPLRQDRDYSADPGSPTVYDSGLAEQTRPAIAAIKIGDEYWLLDRLGPAARAETTIPNGIKWSANLRSYQHGAGLRLVPSEPNHVFGAEDLEVTELALSDAKPQCAYQDLLATVYVRNVSVAEVIYPPRPQRWINGQASVRYIDVGDKFQMIWMPKDTVLGVDGFGEPIRAAQGGWIRNDWQRMSDLARLAWEWYQIERQNVRFVTSYIEGSLGLGDLIAELGFGDPPIKVNTLVTQIEWDFSTGHTSINTSGAESIDFEAFV